MSRESFERLLQWLGSDRESGAESYEQIRRRLVHIFDLRGSRAAEELADETFDRVARRLEEGGVDNASDPHAFIHGVAMWVLHESWERAGRQAALAPELMLLGRNEPAPQPARLECLEECLARLSAEENEIIRRYYQGEKRERMENRRRLAEELGVSLNALRIRAHRVRRNLEACIHRSLRSREMKPPSPPLST
ncbi:MAG: sigma-70 family RNA polymerase sigma factor [Candidatus Solibacter usitatus]|nr:sigma-70 family RNA polymerase sigma factor [Candidatus Solibacter usitatus]